MRSVLYTAIISELAAINAYVVPLVGEKHVRLHDPPPRMIFIPRTDTPGPPEGPGGNPRPLFTVLEESELVIHGETTDHVEGMRDQFMIALHHACKKASPGTARAGRYQVAKGEYAKGAALFVKNGLEYRMRFAVAYPVVDRKWVDEIPKQAPTPSTYSGDQANTYPVVPSAELKALVDVGVRDNPPADDNVEIDITAP